MNKVLGAFIGLLSLSSVSYAQQVVFSSDSTKKIEQPEPPKAKPRPIKLPKPIRNELSFGLRVNTNGWSVYTDYGRAKTNDMKRVDMFHNVLYLQTEFTEKKDPKEEKVKSQTISNRSSSTYIYGKVNNFYALKIGLGYRKLIAGKPDPGCVAIHWATTGGFALGLLKPYYITLVGGSQSIKYTDINQSDFLDERIIQGNSGFSKGMNEIQFVPGGHLKSALHFDFSANRKNVIGVEAGVNAEFYSTPVMLMANQKPTSAFYDLFVSFQFGRRW
ncbi:hypothetical protein CJD36_001325 [Flavipsychrobacter stenotrophus]|uniref:Outer membrane protein beta-barrel domain-containing protein n=1 Tax=Flavipsychrobacter stenotrophus TaxID=2077091 RepID=A0A2S7SZP2_9BACT|nr:hypothetical protein [Flavipsychrobacter stenotrophus]PQJ12420.1 hypothetical protein CJD36_001325 [Flavipsychrobacter stenotrophus]